MTQREQIPGRRQGQIAVAAHFDARAQVEAGVAAAAQAAEHGGLVGGAQVAVVVRPYRVQQQHAGTATGAAQRVDVIVDTHRLGHHLAGAHDAAVEAVNGNVGSRSRRAQMHPAAIHRHCTGGISRHVDHRSGIGGKHAAAVGADRQHHLAATPASTVAQLVIGLATRQQAGRGTQGQVMSSGKHDAPTLVAARVHRAVETDAAAVRGQLEAPHVHRHIRTDRKVAAAHADQALVVKAAANKLPGSVPPRRQGRVQGGKVRQCVDIEAEPALGAPVVEPGTTAHVAAERRGPLCGTDGQRPRVPLRGCGHIHHASGVQQHVAAKGGQVQGAAGRQRLAFPDRQDAARDIDDTAGEQAQVTGGGRQIGASGR